MMIYSKSFLLLLFLFGVDRILAIKSNFLEVVKNSTLVHHKQTNTVWEYLGTYAQTDDTINFILEIPVFQFMCDVFPISMAFAMKACTQYRTRLLENGSARRLTELVEARVGQRDKRQIGEFALGAFATYSGYRIIGDLFGGKNDEIIERLDRSESFQKHQETLDDALITSILSLEDNNLVMLKSFKNLFDSVNETRSLIYNLLKMSLREQGTFTGWAKFSLKSEMRRHYEQIVAAFTRVGNHDLNLEMFSPEQRTFVHEFLWHRIQKLLPENFSISLAQFVPNLLVQQIISFSQVNESEIVYELKEDDFNFVVEIDSHDIVTRNETIDLDSILPKIVGHARIENFFGIPTNFSHKKMDLFKITRLPMFVEGKKAVYIANLPQYLSLAEDGSSSEWSEHKDRKCTVDEQSKYMFCSVPLPVFSSIQNACLRSIILNISTTDCLRETVDLSSPYVLKLAPNIHAISVYTSLQCFEKGDKIKKNVFSNVTKVAIIKTHCNSYISCGALDFQSLGGVCDRVESYVFTFNTSYEHIYRLDKSVNPVDVEINDLKGIMDISSLIDSALAQKSQLKNAQLEFQSNIHRVIKTKLWPKVLIGIFLFILIVIISIIAYASKLFLKKITCVSSCRKLIDFLIHICFKRKKCQVANSLLDIDGDIISIAENDTSYDNVHHDKKTIEQYQPLLNRAVCNNLLVHPLQLSRTTKELSSFSPPTILESIPLETLIDSSDVLSTNISYRKPYPPPRKIYNNIRGSIDLTPNHSSTTSGEYFEDHVSLN